MSAIDSTNPNNLNQVNHRPNPLDQFQLILLSQSYPAIRRSGDLVIRRPGGPAVRSPKIDFPRFVLAKVNYGNRNYHPNHSAGYAGYNLPAGYCGHSGRPSGSIGVGRVSDLSGKSQENATCCSDVTLWPCVLSEVYRRLFQGRNSESDGGVMPESDVSAGSGSSGSDQ